MNIEDLVDVVTAWRAEGYLGGELDVDPQWYELWLPEKIGPFTEEYEIPKYAPGYLTFGGNGGGELLVVNKSGEVFYMPSIGMSKDTAIKIASSLDEFKGYMRK